MHAPRLDARTIERLHRQAHAERWQVSIEAFGAALRASLDRAPADAGRNPDRYVSSLHLEDLALACACADGHDGAWEHFIREYRPLLYRAADALAPDGGAREIADGLYGELFGLTEREGERRSLLRYFHGRSALGTWLRAVLAQRFVDAVRAAKRLEPLQDEDAPPPAAGSVGGTSIVAQGVTAADPDPDAPEYIELTQRALASAMASLAPRERLRLGLYYAQELTLAETGRLLGEHEATVSRQLARTRRAIRAFVEEALTDAGLMPDEVERCFELAVEDAGALDLSRLTAVRKHPEVDRST